MTATYNTKYMERTTDMYLLYGFDNHKHLVDFHYCYYCVAFHLLQISLLVMSILSNMQMHAIMNLSLVLQDILS